MSDGSETEPSEAAETAPSQPASARRRRLAAWLGGGLATLLLLFVLVVFVLPTPVARYVIESQLEGLGIQHGGIDTVEIDLWNSRVRAGPVAFRAGEAQGGQIGETGFDYSFGELFDNRAFVQTFYLRGVDVYVTRLKDGAIAINGINLHQLSQSEETTAEAPADEDEQESGFGFGGDAFEFSDSRLVFEDVSGGTLAMDLERLTLERLQTWTPNEPTAFALQGRLNEIELALDGTIVPLGDPLIATLNTRVTGVTLDRIAQFVGPTGLTKQEGSVESEVHYNYAIYRSGRIEGTVDGTYNLTGLDIATAEGEVVTLDAATLKVDLHQQLPGDGSAVASGRVRLDGGRLSIATAAGDVLEAGTLEAGLDSLDLHISTQPRERLLELTPPAGATAKRTPSIVELLIGWARDLGRRALDHRLSIDGEPTVTLTDGLVRLAARNGAQGHELRFDQARADLGEVASEAFDAGWSATGTLDTVISGLRLALQDGTAEARLAEMKVNSQAVDFKATRSETALSFDLDVALQQLVAGNSDGATLDLKRLALTSERIRIAETPDSEEAGGPLTLALENLAANLPGPEGVLSLRGDGLDLKFAPFTLSGKQGEAVNFTGSITARNLSLERAGAASLSASLASTSADLSGFRIAPLDERASITGKLTAGLSELRFEAGQGPEALTLSLHSLDHQAEQLQLADLGGGIPSILLSGRTRLDNLSASLPGPEGVLSLRGEALDITLAPFALSRELGESASLTGSIAARGLAVDRPGEFPLSAALATLRSDLDDLQVAPLGPQAEIAGGFTTSLSELRFELGQGKEAVMLALQSFDSAAEGLQVSGLDSDGPSVSLAGRAGLSGLTARLPVAEGLAAEATVESLAASLSELALSGTTGRLAGDLEISGISAAASGDRAQSLDIAQLAVSGFKGDSESGAEIDTIALGETIARLTLPLPAMPTPGEDTARATTQGAEAAGTETPQSGGAGGADPQPVDRRFAIGAFTLAPGSRIEIADRSVEPPLQANLLIEELRLGPIDTAAPQTRTDLALALAVNGTSKASLRGWASPLKAKPDFELASKVEGLPLHDLSAYAAVMTGVNVESGELSAGIDARASDAALAGNIDLRIKDLFVTPLSEAEAERLKADIGLPIGFAVSILKDSKGVIAFGLPLSGTVEAPEVDYSQAIDKAVSGALASVFPTSWFGPDGNTFKMQPAPFVAGTAELTEEGLEIANQMGGLFANKPGISIRACGRAGRADLVALRSDPLELPADGVMPAAAPAATAAPPDAPADTPGDAAGATPSNAAGAAPESAASAVTAALPSPSEKDISAPSDEEVQALLALATERGLAVRKYLAARYGVDPGRVAACRTAYSIDDGKPPRAEFQF